MNINACKALVGLSLVASCGIALIPHPAAAQTTLPTITVIGHPPQSAAEIQQRLDDARRPQPSWIEDVLESVGVVDGPVYPQTSLTLSTTDCRSSQDVRTNAVAEALSGPNPPTYLLFGTEVRVQYKDESGSETFVVTGGGSGAPNSDPVRAVTPVAGSLVCNP